MKLHTLSATFGNLEQAKLSLSPGLNIITASNEGGKSTWSGFIRAMLYGIDTRDRDKKGYLADKNRYQPWSGSPMEGELSLTRQGQRITLRRGPRAGVPFGSFSALYTATEEPVPGLTGENCGQMLTGVGRDVFERSAFIGQGASMAPTPVPELERRIAALVSTGEEDISFSQVESRLKEWQRRRKHNKSGLIPRLEEARLEVDEALRRLEHVTGRIAALAAQARALEARSLALEEELRCHNLLAKRALDRRYTQARRELSAAQAEAARLQRESGRFGPLPSKEELRRAQGELAYLSSLEPEIRRAETVLQTAEAALTARRGEAEDSRFPDMTGQDALLRAQREQAEAETALSKERQARRSLGWLSGSCVALSALFAAGAVWITPWLALGVAAALLCLPLTLLFQNRRAGQYRKTAENLLQRYGVDRAGDILSVAQEYNRRQGSAEEAALHLRQVRLGLEELLARRENGQQDIRTFVHTFTPEVKEIFGCSAAISRALGLEESQNLARQQLLSAQKLFDELAAQGGHELTDASDDVPPLQSTPQEVQARLSAVCQELAQTQRELAQAQGEQQALGDPAALSARQQELHHALARRQAEYAALDTALALLHGANVQLQERFSPELNRRAGVYFARLTGARYEHVSLNRELEAAVTEAGGVLPRRALALSQGTADQLYLAVRLAVCDLCLSGDEPAPLILDDVLASFDQTRLELALTVLEELSNSRQILLFTCHQRESLFIAPRGTGRCIDLP